MRDAAGSVRPTFDRCAFVRSTAHASRRAPTSRFALMSRRATATAGLLLALALASCARDEVLAGARRAPDDTLVVNLYSEPETIDPALAHGHPDHVVARQLFDGLYEADPTTLEPVPSLAEHHERSPDGLTHRFTLRQDVVWSDGRPLTAHDVVASIERVLRPSTASRAAAVLWILENARLYTEGRIRRVATERVRPRRPPFVVFGSEQAAAPALGVFPERAVVELVDSNLRMVRGDDDVPLLAEAREDAPQISVMPRGATAIVLAQKEVDGRVWLQVRPDEGGRAAWSLASALVPAYRGVDLRAVEGERDRGHRRAVLAAPAPDASVAFLVDDDADLEVLSEGETYARVIDPSSGRAGFVETEALDDVAGDRVWYVARVKGDVADGEVREGWVRARDLAIDADLIGARAVDDHVVELRLLRPVPYLLSLLTMSALRPVPLHAVEKHGRAWTRPGLIVTSGPFTVEESRVHDRIVLARSATHRARDAVALARVVFLFVVDEHTAISLYRAGQLDTMLAGRLPLELIGDLRERRDYVESQAFATYFLKLNTTRGPLVDPRVRRALELAVDKQALTQHLLRAGQKPAAHLVPEGIPGYPVVEGDGHDVSEARRLLAEAGFRDGEGFPTLRYVFNTSDHHRTIAEFLQRQWREALGIDVELENQEWKTYLERLRALDYDVARSGWIGEYLDPTTFLAQLHSTSPNNETGFSSTEFDALMARADGESDPTLRLALLAEAERIVVAEKPVLPLFFYVNNAMRAPWVRGYAMNLLDHHALAGVRIAPSSDEVAR